MSAYGMAGQTSEIERLRLQSRVWEAAGEELLDLLPRRRRALDVGCGAMGWLRILSRWVSEGGEVLGSDIDERLLQNAGALVQEERLRSVRLLRDDLFSSALPARSFDLVHARFEIAPLGRAREQVEAYRGLLAPGGILVLEDPDSSTWSFEPNAPALERLISYVKRAFTGMGGDFDAGLAEADLLRAHGFQTTTKRHVVQLEAGHPYLRLPIQFATSLRSRIEAFVSPQHLSDAMDAAESEFASGVRGQTFTLVQTVGHLP
jgi:SAM-dependent methyltransferase